MKYLKVDLVQPSVKTVNLMEGCTAVGTLDIKFVDFVNLDYQPVEQETQNIPASDYWGIELGVQKEFNRKEIYEDALPHRFKYSNIRS